MKTKIILFAAALSLLVVIGGCGLISGMLFLSQEISGQVRASNSTEPTPVRGGSSTLDSWGGARVDLTTNDDWDKIDIDGVEDLCIRMTATNNLSSQAVSGEVWVTVGDTQYATPAEVAANGFRVFSGLALTPGQSRVFTCAETLLLFENLDRLSAAVQGGVFWVWGRGDQETFDITYDGIYLGMHVTGSL